MQSRGVVVTDVAKASDYLGRIGYYRLSGYSYPFRISRPSTDAQGLPIVVFLDDFIPGTNFSTIIDLYVFDKKLRMIMLDAIERIEVGLRVAMATVLGARDPLGYMSPTQLHGNFAKKHNWRGRSDHSEWLDRFNECVKRSNAEFIDHFHTKYAGSHLPIWIAIEVWDFGLMSRFLAGMTYADQRALALKFGIPRPELLVSWVRAINSVRNACAHHSRLWNASVTDNPKPAKAFEVPLLGHVANDINAHTRLYYVAAVLQYLMRTINPSSTWKVRLKQDLATLPDIHPITKTSMGFPADWDTQPLWQ
jgi:abortive infection bacteriophage resistance protein